MKIVKTPLRTWHIFADDPDFADVLLRLPMTKGAVRAMDTAEDFLISLGHQKPVRWVGWN